MSNGFALIAWPAEYDVTGIMSFIVNQDGIIREKDLGPESDSVARAMTNILQVSRENLDSVAEASSATSALARQAEELARLISTFRTS